MNKSILWFLTVVIVLARCSAESIPATSETSGFAVPHSTQAHERDKHNIDEAPREERENFLIESFISSVKAADESRPGTIHAVNMVDEPQLTESSKAIHKANMMDVSEIKELNKVLATRMETLGIDIDGIVLVTKALKPVFPDFSFNNLEWMILGKVYFGRDGSSTGYRVLPSKELFKELNMKITNTVEITKWSKRLNNFHVRANVVFGKMLWLLQNQNELNLHLADAAKMAFGSEHMETRQLPTANEIIEAVGEQNVNRDLVESIVRQDKDSRKSKMRTDRGRFAIESFTSSVKTADESLPRTKHADSMMDVSEIKERDKVLATRMEALGIDIDGIVLVTKALKPVFPDFSFNNLEWMILGKVYFGRDGSSTGYRVLPSKELFKELNMKITNTVEITKWSRRLNNFHVRANVVFGKMLWLLQNQNELNLHLADAAKMAFGSEHMETRQLPTANEIIEAVGEQNVNRDLVESIVRQDKDSRKRKMRTDRGRFAIESFTSSVKTADESLPRTKHADSMMDVSEIKERDKVLATRMEALGINIDGIVLVTKALKPVFPDFSFNNLEWMILGKVYFGRDGSSTGYRVLPSKELFKELNMKITNTVEITKWSRRLNNFHVRANVVFGKMLWLLQNQNELNLHLADAAKMAFGSEYLEARKLPSANEIIEAVGEQNVNRDLVESIVRQDKDSRKSKMRTDRGRFAIELFTSSVKTADESLPRTKHADSMMDVSEIKERDKVLATQLEKLGIDIGGVVFVTGALESALKRSFSRNNLGWMVLGKAYFEKVGSITDYSSLQSKELFEKLNMEIINYEEIKKWVVRVNGFQVGARKVFGKMLWLLQEQKDLNLDVADAAKMAFGSEYLNERKLPFSDELIQAMTVHNVDKDVTKSLMRQDKDSTMKDIAMDKLLETIRNYFDEEVHEQSNKKRKLA